MDDQPSADTDHPPLTIDQLIALEPRFGAWLDDRAIPPDERAKFLKEGWAGQFYAEAVIAGIAAGLEPFLAAIDAEVFRLKQGYGARFVENLLEALFAANAHTWSVSNKLPPTLLLCWDEWYAWDDYQNRHDTWSYGAYSGGLPPYGSGY